MKNNFNIFIIEFETQFFKLIIYLASKFILFIKKSEINLKFLKNFLAVTSFKKNDNINYDKEHNKNINDNQPELEEEDEYHSSDESDYTNFPEISQIVEIKQSSATEKVYNRPLVAGSMITKQEDPFLKDLTARLQLKQRQKKVEEQQQQSGSLSSGKDTSISPKHSSSSKSSSKNTSPIHQTFSIFKSSNSSNKEDTTILNGTSKDSSSGSTPKRFNLHSFNLNGNKMASNNNNAEGTNTLQKLVCG